MIENGEQFTTEIIDPDLPIIDPHHHLGYQYGGRYLAEEFAADIATGHNILATVYIECSVMYRANGPEHLRPVGEVEFAAGQAAISESGGFGPAHICAGIVGAVDFTLGERVDEVLDAMTAAGGGRFRGVRGSAIWDADPSVNTGTREFAPRGMLLDSTFRAAFARLAARDLVYDAFQYFSQTDDLCSLADAFPNARIVIDHCGGLLGIGPYATADNFDRWKAAMAAAAKRPNLTMKLGGLAGKRNGFGFEKRTQPASEEEIVALWRPYLETCIELFGPQRCMFESNYLPDKHAGHYRTLWNVFKRVASGASASEKADLFRETANRVYRVI
jgi:L-fuconolactonase